MGQKVKAIFLDLDGTLLSFNTHTVPKSAHRALEKARKQGVLLFVATGRHKHEIEQIDSLDLGLFSGFVTQNGQYCYAKEQVLFHRPFPKEDLTGLVKLLEKRPTPCLFGLADEMFLNCVDDKVIRCLEHIATEMPPLGNVTRVPQEEVYQLVIYGDLAHAQPYLKAMPHCTGACSSGAAVDVYPSDGGKQHGIRHMINRFGIAREEIMVVGDGSNDLGMLAYGGLSVAMGNAPDEVKAAADYVCPGTDEDGIAAALEQFVLVG